MNSGALNLVIDGTQVRLAYLQKGGVKTPLVCLHGFGSNKEDYADLGDTDIANVGSGVEICPGDIVVGDADRIVIVPSEAADDVLTKVAVVAEQEETIRARIHAGETTFDIFVLAP